MQTHHNIESRDNFLASMTLAKQTGAKINKWYYIKLKSFCPTKETRNIIKNTAQTWDKYLSNIQMTKKCYPTCIK